MFRPKHIILRSCPRTLSLLPQITEVRFASFRYLPRQQVSDVQIMFHPEGKPHQQRFRVNGVEYEVGYPHIQIKRPGEIIEAEPGCGQTIYFKDDPADAPVLPEDLVVSDILPSTRMHEIIGELYQMLDHSWELGTADRIDLLCMMLLTELLLSCRTKVTESPCHIRIRKAASWFSTHPEKKIDEAARIFGFSRRSFDRHWVEVFGDSPGHYLQELRISEARHLLAETNLSVEEIAFQLGYREVTNFSAAFKNKNGLTPLAFRRTFH